MLGAMEKMIARFGTTMVLVHEGQEQELRAFLQETGSRSQESAQRAFSSLGEVPKGLYVYIGPISPGAVAGDLLICQQRCFELRRAETVMVGDQAAYVWGLCVQKSGDSTWGG